MAIVEKLRTESKVEKSQEVNLMYAEETKVIPGVK